MSKFTQYNFHYTCNQVLHIALWVTPSFVSMVVKGLCNTTGAKNQNIFFVNECERRHEKQEIGEKGDREKKGEKGKWKKRWKRKKESEERNM